jgi:hypothetical protein
MMNHQTLNLLTVIVGLIVVVVSVVIGVAAIRSSRKASKLRLSGLPVVGLIFTGRNVLVGAVAGTLIGVLLIILGSLGVMS